MAEESIGTARIDVVVGTNTMDAGIEAAKRRVSGLGAEAEQQFNKASASTKRYAGSLLRQADMLGKTRAEQIAYNAQMRIGGGLGDSIAKKALAQQAALSAGMGATGKSVKELQFAMRGMPAQITDVFTSLASGQRPMLVLLQQGGQIKDMFGGIMPAAKALGASLIALVNPLTISAAAIGAMLFAWKQGSDEAVAFNKALITTGNYAGLTADRLQDMSASMARSGVTQHAAAAALAEVASSGKFTAEQIGLVGRAALAMSDMTGQATKDTIKQFEELGEKPVEAILKLNDSQHFLTSAVYEQIKALDDQGRAQEAASLAMQTYSNALDDRRAEVVQNAGIIEKAWASVASSAKFAWDAMLGVGRDDTTSTRIAELHAQLVSASQTRLGQPEPLARYNGRTGSFEATGAGSVFGHDPIQDKINELKSLQDKELAAEKVVTDKANASRLVQDEADSDRQAAQYFTNAQKRAREYLKAENEFNDRIKRARDAGNAKLAAQEEASKKAVLSGINSKYEDKAGAKRAAKMAGFWATPIGNDPHVDLTKEMDESIKAYKKEAEQWARSTSAAAAYKSTLDDMLATRQQAIDLQVQSIGMGQREAEQQQALIGIDEDYNRKKADLQKRQQSATSQLDKEGYQQQLDDLADYHDQRIQMEMDGWKRSADARKNAALGARAAISDFIDDAGNAAAQAHDVFTNAFDGMADALAKFVTTGKLNLSDLAQSFIADMAKMEMRILASQVLQSIFGMSTAAGYNNATPAQQVAFDAAHGSALGNVFNTPNLSAYSNTIVDKPTFFAMGGNVMGEAGPEAIMPLTRGPNGKLGVQSSGGGEAPQVEINITNNGQAVQAQQTGQRMDGRKMIIDMVIEAVANDVASGGKVAKAGQQRFGWQRRGVPVGGA